MLRRCGYGGLLFTFVSMGGLAGGLACGQSADRVGARATVAGLLGLTSAGAFALAFARVIVPITVGESGKGRALAL